MPRLVIWWLFFGGLSWEATSPLSSDPIQPPTQEGESVLYELMINGETFLLEANRVVKLQSKLHPQTTYEVGLRISPIQYHRVGRIRVGYDLRTKLHKDGPPEPQSVRLVHPKGANILITELGNALAPGDRERALRLLTEAMVQTYRARQISEAKLQLIRLQTLFLPAAEARGVEIRYQDAKGLEHRCLIYLIVGKGFSCSCIVEYLHADAQEVLPIVKRTLDSIQPVQDSPGEPIPPKTPSP